ARPAPPCAPDAAAAAASPAARHALSAALLRWRQSASTAPPPLTTPRAAAYQASAIAQDQRHPKPPDQARARRDRLPEFPADRTLPTHAFRPRPKAACTRPAQGAPRGRAAVPQPPD